LIYTPIGDWWCCLNPRERNSLQSLIVFFVTNPVFILRAEYEIVMTATGMNSFIKMKEFFEQFYGLTAGTIEGPEGEPIEVMFFSSGNWLLLAAFALTGGFICSQPCKVLTFPL